MHFDRFTDGPAPPVWHTTPGLGLHAGCDLVRTHAHHFAVFGRVDTAPLSDVSFSAFTAGAAWRW